MKFYKSGLTNLKRNKMNYIARGCMYCEGICNKECLPKKETVDEAAEKQYPTIHEQYQYDAFIEGAKWQMDKQSDVIIGFLEFIEGTYSYSNIYDHWYLHANTSKTYSKKQLLEVYLKRNKL